MLGAGRGVIFAGPQAIGSERYNSTADILALLSEFKTFGMAVLEAMAAGLPVVVSESMGVRHVIGGSSGRVLGAEATSGAIADALSGLRKIAVPSMSTERGWKFVASRVDALYSDMLRSRAR